MKNLKGSVIILVVLLFSTTQITKAQMFWNQGAEFNGYSSYVTVPNSTSLNITSSFTLQAWVNPYHNQGETIIDKCSFTGGYQMRFDVNHAGRIIIVSGVWTMLESKASTVIPINKWTQITETFDAPTNIYAIYINGVLDTSVNANPYVSPPQSCTNPLWIGIGDGGWHDQFWGQLDEVRIWNRALSSAEINSTLYVPLAVQGTGSYKGLVLCYNFQTRSSQGTTLGIYDWSGNGNTGTMTNVTAVNLSNRPSHTTSYNTALSTGTGSWFAVPNSSAINISGGFTAEAWVFTTTPASGHYSPVISKYRTGAEQGFTLGLSSSGTILSAINTTGLGGNTVLPSNRWNHIAMSVTSGGLASYYINGNFDFSYNFGAPPLSHNDSLYIGSRDLKDYFFNGLIDEVRISNYPKTQQQINDGMYVSIDQVNDPNIFGTDAVFNFDGSGTTSCDANITGFFRGGAKITTATKVAGVYYPQSPLFRKDNDYFPAGWFLKSSSRRIPQTGTSGNMVDDSLNVSDTHTINDLNFFVALNHTYTQDLTMYLISPTADTLKVYDRNYTIGRDNLVTVFDDQADSSMTNASYVTFSPVVKPVNSLNAKFGGKNPQGIWKLRIIDNAGGDTGIVYNWGIQINNEAVKGVMGKPKANNQTPFKFALMQNYPNPFNPSTSIKFTVPSGGIVTLKVYDLLGQEVAVIVNEKLEAGEYSRTFDASTFASGVYFYKLETGSYVDTKKMMLIK